MSSYGTFTPKLEAVNQILSSIGQSRVSSLATAGEANDVQKVLEEVDKAVQSEGWHYNRFYEYELTRGTGQIGGSLSGSVVTTSAKHFVNKGETMTDISTAKTHEVTAVSDSGLTFTLAGSPAGAVYGYTKRIQTPSDALSLDFNTYTHTSLDPIVRGRFLYDKYNNSYEFDDDVKCTIIYQVAFQQDTAGEPSLPEYARRYITTKAARIFAARYVGDPQLVQMLGQDEMEAKTNALQQDSDNADTNIFASSLAHYTVSRTTSSNTAPIATLYKT